MNFLEFCLTLCLLFKKKGLLLLKNALKLTNSKVKTKKFAEVLLPLDTRFRGGEGRDKRKNGRANEMEGYGPPHFFIQVYAYESEAVQLRASTQISFLYKSLIQFILQ